MKIRESIFKILNFATLVLLTLGLILAVFYVFVWLNIAILWPLALGLCGLIILASWEIFRRSI